MPITRARRNWLNQKNIIRGKQLLYPDAISARYFREVWPIIEAMHVETEERVLAMFDTRRAAKALPTYDARSETLTEATKRLIDSLLNKYTRIFDKHLGDIIKKMLDATNQHSESLIADSLSAIQAGLIIQPDFLKGEMKEKFAALTQENVSLFRTITSDHFEKVENAVMQSITTGRGMKDLVPFFEAYSNGEKNYAYNRAKDQTRKAYSSINAARIQSLGIKKFEWIHSGGSNHPRKLHQSYDGKIFEFAKPPVIYTDKGREVHGLPGQAIYCSCSMRPVIELDDD